MTKSNRRWLKNYKRLEREMDRLYPPDWTKHPLTPQQRDDWNRLVRKLRLNAGGPPTLARKEKP